MSRYSRPLVVFTLTSGHSGSYYLARLFRSVREAYSHWGTPSSAAHGPACNASSRAALRRCNFSSETLEPINSVLTGLELRVKDWRNANRRDTSGIPTPVFLDAQSTFLDEFAIPAVSILQDFDFKIVHLTRHPPAVVRSMLCTWRDRTEGWRPRSALAETLKSRAEDVQWDDVDEVMAFVFDFQRRAHEFCVRWLQVGVVDAVVRVALEQLQTAESAQDLFATLGINGIDVDDLLRTEIGVKRHSHMNRSCDLPSDAIDYYEERYVEFIDTTRSFVPDSNLDPFCGWVENGIPTCSSAVNITVHH